MNVARDGEWYWLPRSLLIDDLPDMATEEPARERVTTDVFGEVGSNFLVQRRINGLLVCVKTEDMTEFRGVLLPPERALQLAEEILRMYGSSRAA